jgi:hypothetical protein
MSKMLLRVPTFGAKQSDPPWRIILSKSKDPSTSLGTMLCIRLLRRCAPRIDGGTFLTVSQKVPFDVIASVAKQSHLC